MLCTFTELGSYFDAALKAPGIVGGKNKHYFENWASNDVTLYIFY